MTRPLLTSLFLFAVSFPASASICFVPADDQPEISKWAYEFGVALLTSNTIDDILLGQRGVHIESGSAGGEIYNLTASRRLGELRWEIGEHTFTPQLEVPLMLEIVDENGRSPFLDYNASFVIRWVNFPWNKYVKTTFGTGVGLSYSSKVYQMDIDRHLGEDRSHLKFNWPIQLTLASPNRPQDQLMLYIAHQSGGHIFDHGGVNSLGVGYRRGF
jgi:hypothetical protein